MSNLSLKQINGAEVKNILTPLGKTSHEVSIFGVSGSDVVLTQDITVAGSVYSNFTAGTAVTLPILVNATDYKIYANSTGLVAQAWDAVAPANSVLLGGFHVYHTTGGVNPHSLWDLKWRPSCSPRGMTLSPDNKVWVDIYKMDVDYGINGYSKADATIADGGSLPKKPLIYGGNGTTTYTGMTWYNSWDLAISAGKRLPFYGEFTGFAYGVVEAQSVGTDPVTAKYQAGYRSACGVEQATGVMYDWGADVSAGVGTMSWQAITDGRGSVYVDSLRAVKLGGAWDVTSNSGSRCSLWDNSPSFSSTNISARAVCDHEITP